jgi:hypothetical protein
MLCPICRNWERIGDMIAPHHPLCDRNEANLLHIITRLREGIKKWAAEEDGVPDWLWDVVKSADRVIASEAPSQC